MKVSFDFDETLSTWTIQEYAKELVERGVEVWIVTTRWNRKSKFCDPEYYNLHGNTWKEVHDLSLEIGIPLKHIIFTNYTWKGEYFSKNSIDDFIWHLDDNKKEHDLNYSKIPIITFYYSNYNWKNKCEELMKNCK